MLGERCLMQRIKGSTATADVPQVIQRVREAREQGVHVKHFSAPILFVLEIGTTPCVVLCVFCVLYTDSLILAVTFPPLIRFPSILALALIHTHTRDAATVDADTDTQRMM